MGPRPGVDHLERAWCCTLLTLGESHCAQPVDVAGQLAESCLALGGDLPELAEQLLAWRAVSVPPSELGWRRDGPGPPDPAVLLAILLLRAARDAGDPRLPALARDAADGFAAQLGWEAVPTRSGSYRTWRALVAGILAPLRTTHPDIDRLATVLDHTRRCRDTPHGNDAHG